MHMGEAVNVIDQHLILGEVPQSVIDAWYVIRRGVIGMQTRKLFEGQGDEPKASTIAQED